MKEKNWINFLHLSRELKKIVEYEGDSNTNKGWNYRNNPLGGRPRGIVTNILDCDIVVSEFKLQSRNYVNFFTNNLEKGSKLLITFPVMS